MTNPIIEAMALAMAVRVGLNPTSKAFGPAFGPWMEDAKAAYLAALPMIVEQCAKVAEEHSCDCDDSFCEIKQTSNYIQDALRTLAAAKVEELK